MDKFKLTSNSQAARGSLTPSASLSPIETKLPTQRQFLRFLLSPHLTALIEIDDRLVGNAVGHGQRRHQRVTELVNIQIDRVVPMPHLPPAVMGVYNWRGEILWIVDLAMLLGIVVGTRRYRSLQPTIILASSTSDGSPAGMEQEQTIGLVVEEIAEIEWYQPDLIRPHPDRVTSALSTWVRGVWESAQGNFLVVDGQAIFDRADFDADV